MLLERIDAAAYLSMGDNPNILKRKICLSVDEHQARYRFAVSVAYALPSVNTIIDAASGAGWGTRHLAQNTTAETVTGIDLDNDAIAEAKTHFSHAKVRYLQADLLKPEQFSSVNYADLFVSFETLEHFPQEKGAQLLQTIRGKTRDKGKLTISTPNRPLFSPYGVSEGKSCYSYHSKEYTSDEFISILQNNGWQVEGLYGQRFVNKETYLDVAQRLHIFRKIAFAHGLPADHRLSRMPLSLLHRYVALRSDAEIHDVDTRKGQTPIFFTAICTAA